MVAQKILEGNVLWSFDHELENKNNAGFIRKLLSLFPFFKSKHKHQGEILLASNGIFISGDEQLELPLTHIKEVYMGFDDLFPATAINSLALFWQPIRIRSIINRHQTQTVYMVINRNGFFSDNQTWFNALITLLHKL